MASVDWASCTTWSAYSEQEYTKCDDQHNTVAAIFYSLCSFCFLKIVTPSSGITNLRHPYGPLHIRLEMNTFCFKQIDGLLAKFLAL